MKKSIMSASCVLLLICTMCFQSFAVFGGLNATADMADDDKIIVVVGFDDSLKNICGGNFTLIYNTQYLTLSDYYTKSSGYTAEINPNYNGGNLIRCSFFSATAIQDGKEIAVFTFSVKSGGVTSSDLSFSDYRLYNENGELVSDNDKKPVTVSFNSLPQSSVSEVAENITGSGFTKVSSAASGSPETTVIAAVTNADGSVNKDSTVVINESENTSLSNGSVPLNTAETTVVDAKATEPKQRKSKSVLVISLVISVAAVAIAAVTVVVINKKRRLKTTE